MYFHSLLLPVPTFFHASGFDRRDIVFILIHYTWFVEPVLVLFLWRTFSEIAPFSVGCVLNSIAMVDGLILFLEAVFFKLGGYILDNGRSFDFV